MDLGNENVRVRTDSDRISSLPDEIIHHILSFNDTKYAVQTSVLSSRWKLVWTTLPYLKFSTGQFRILPKFSKFVNRVLSRRNNLTEVSTVDLYFRGRVNQKFVQNIANYAVSHNVQKVNIFACEHNVKEDHQFPLCLFSSQSLKHLSLKTNPLVHHIFPLPQLPWDSPALTTIELNDVLLCAESITCLDLFSKCVSLMNLTLIRCYANGLKVMKILCPRLVHLTISRCWPTKYEVVAPNLSSFCYEGGNPLFLSTGGLNSLDKVNLSLTINSVNLNEDKQTIAHEFMNLLHELRNAKFVTLYGPFIEFLSLVLDLLEHQPSPFCNLKCLSIKEVEKRRKRTKSDKTNQVITYLLNSSPTATVNIEFQKESVVLVVKPGFPPPGHKLTWFLKQESKHQGVVKLSTSHTHRNKLAWTKTMCTSLLLPDLDAKVSLSIKLARCPPLYAKMAFGCCETKHETRAHWNKLTQRFHFETFITRKRPRRRTSLMESLTFDDPVIQAILYSPQFEERINAAYSKALLQFGIEDTPSTRRCLLPPLSCEGSSNSDPNLNVQVFFENPKCLEIIDQAAQKIASVAALKSSGIVAPDTPVTQNPPSPSPL